MPQIHSGTHFFGDAFKNLQIPIIVCDAAETLPVLYINVSAQMLLNPMLTTASLKEGSKTPLLSDFLRFQSEGEYARAMGHLQQTGSLDHLRVHILDHEDKPLQMALSANAVEEGGHSYYILYLFEMEMDENLTVRDVNNFLSAAFEIAFRMGDVNEAIHQILAYTGGFLTVDRVYIFEAVSQTMTSNTYEWCAPGIHPEIENLQNLPKQDYNYDAIVQGGLYITNDVRDLPENDRVILEAQGIKALVILPMIDGQTPLGYVGLDDCHKNRVWSTLEISLLKNVSNLILSLLIRRNAEAKLRRSQDILQRITDSSDNIVYVNDIDTYELVFVNKNLADSLEKKPKDLLGQPCWKVLQKDMDGPCSFCPIPNLIDEEKNVLRDAYLWEHQNTWTQRWYMIRDSIIPWIDNRPVHIESCTDITHRKAYEEQLVQYASYDMMTGTFNREWGYKQIEEMRKDPRLAHLPICLIFVDLDGLKQVNDTHGHAMGDEMITETIRILRESIRKDDLICRWGGDEFLLAIACDVPTAHKIMGNVYQKMEVFNAEAKTPYRLSFSYGVTLLSRDESQTLDAQISAADERMYHNKMEKRGGAEGRSRR